MHIGKVQTPYFFAEEEYYWFWRSSGVGLKFLQNVLDGNISERVYTATHLLKVEVR